MARRGIRNLPHPHTPAVSEGRRDQRGRFRAKDPRNPATNQRSKMYNITAEPRNNHACVSHCAVTARAAIQAKWKCEMANKHETEGQHTSARIAGSTQHYSTRPTVASSISGTSLARIQLSRMHGGNHRRREEQGGGESVEQRNSSREAMPSALKPSSLLLPCVANNK